MQQYKQRSTKRRIGLTPAGHPAFIVPNRLNQDFSAQHPNEKWVTDTTYIPTCEGWLYLGSVMDLHSRQVVGWAMGERHDALLATSALDMAVQRQRPAPGLIVHSDRGSEFANARFHQPANEAQIRLSMSSTGHCYDNAAAESFFATVKLEAVHGQWRVKSYSPSLKSSTTVSDCIQGVFMPHLSVVLPEALLLH
jgi:putative transposase